MQKPRDTSHKRSNRIIFLNRFFYPDSSPTSTLLSDLAFALGRQGSCVTVITSRLRYDDPAARLPAQESVEGVNLQRVWTSRRGRQRLIGRSLDYFSYYVSSGWRLWCLARPGDIIVAKTDPPLLSIIAAVVARLRGARLINWLQDLFPEIAEALGVGALPARLLFWLLLPLRNWSLRAAEINVVLGTRMAERLKHENIAAERIRIIANWSDGELIKPLSPEANELRKSWGLNGRFVVGYAGNLGRAHDLQTIIEAMSELQSKASSAPTEDLARKIVFLFVGGGAQTKALEQAVWERQLTNVRVHPYQSRERLRETLAAADVHLISLKPELEGLMVPSKFYGAAAAGRPVLFVGAVDGEIAKMIEQAQCGLTIASGNSRELVSLIVEMAQNPQLCRSMGLRARAAFEQNWDKALALRNWQAIIDAASAPTRAAAPEHFAA